MILKYLYHKYMFMRLRITLLTGNIILLLSSVFGVPNAGSSYAHLSGKITDKKSGESIPGVTVYFPVLKIGTATRSDGTYFIDKLPTTKLLVQVNFIGYKMQAREIDLALIKTQDFALDEAATEISEVIVTGQSDVIQSSQTPSPIAIVPRAQLLQNSASNIIDALSKVPGISQVTSGVGISKPIIRGMGYNRVVVVNDGIRQEGQQWGDEHGIEIDENTVSHVEILKGPASLAYGSDAMAGVINMISAPTLPEGSVKGNFSSNYQTNNGLIAYSAALAGNKNGFIWDARYSNKMAHDYQNRYDGYVYNSGFQENAISTTLGVNRSWGFSHLHISSYSLEPGIVEGERDSLTGKFLKTTFNNNGTPVSQVATSTDFLSYKPNVPFQKINHYKAVWNNNFFIGKGNLEATLGFQQNRRKEFPTPDRYGLFFLMNTLNYDFKYNFPEINNWKFISGVNGMWQQSQNKGTEFLVPAYHLFDIGAFAVASKRIGKLDFSSGIRYDIRSETGDALYLNTNNMPVSATDQGAIRRFESFDKSFTGFSGSIGATYQITESIFTKLNLSRGFRAPNIAELGSNGVHEGTQRYEIGNPALKPETSLQLDYALGLNTTHVSAEMDLFTNTVNHFIFSRKLESTSNTGTQFDNLPVFKFGEAKAHFYGGEFQLDIHPHPLDWIHFENTFSAVIGTLDNQPENAHYLPLIPAPHWVSDLKIEFDALPHYLLNTYFKFGIDKTWEQTHIYAAYNTETSTPGYTLFNMGAGTDFIYEQQTRFSLYISVNNLTDVAYQSHLSRLKYTGINYATGRTGIFNQGRNISLKLLIPIDFTSHKSIIN